MSLPKFKQNHYFFLFSFFLFLVFFARALIFIDPDFGWHLKMGELIVSSGIPKTDPFSYTMPSYPFVDHEWLTNIIIHKIFSGLGYAGLAATFAFLALPVLAISFFDVRRLKLFRKVPYLVAGLYLLAAAVLFPVFGIRPQVLSWLFLAFLWTIVADKTRWHKFRWFLPILFLIWVNLHGSFAVGVGVLVMTVGIRTIREKKLPLTDLIVVFASVLSTLINPYRHRVWWEFWQQFSDQTLRSRIEEWKPAFYYFNFPFWTLFSLSLTSIFKYRRQFSWEKLAVVGFFFCQAILSIRNIPLWLVVSLPMTLQAFESLLKEISEIEFGLVRLKKLAVCFFWGVALTSFISIGYNLYSISDFSENNFYPTAGVDLIKENLPSGNIFADYGWGGYLIWKLPEKKVFIDGRMPSWRWEAPLGESRWAMDDYVNLHTGKTAYQEIFDKYQIKVAFTRDLPKRDLIEALSCRLVKCPEGFDLAQELKKDGWIELYRGKEYSVYQRPPAP